MKTDHPENVSLKLAEAATPGPWGEDDGHVFCKPLSDARHAACIASIEGRPHDPAHLTFDAFVATTQQRHGQQSDADATHIAHAHPGRVRAWLGAVARLRERAAEGHAEYCMTQELDARRGFRLDQVVCTCGHEDDLAALAAVDAEG
jgi:hypothetical protein